MWSWITAFQFHLLNYDLISSLWTFMSLQAAILYSRGWSVYTLVIFQSLHRTLIVSITETIVSCFSLTMWFSVVWLSNSSGFIEKDHKWVPFAAVHVVTNLKNMLIQVIQYIGTAYVWDSFSSSYSVGYAL